MAGMANSLVLSIAALLALVPASVLPYRRLGGERGLLFWALLTAAVAGPVALSLIRSMDAWSTGLSMALWLSVATSMAFFAALSLATREAWRMAPLLLPYLLVLAALAVIWDRGPTDRPLTGTPDAWLAVHIVLSLATYALCTLAAVAGMAVFLQERALKRKRGSTLYRLLPPIADAERLQIGLLLAAEVVLLLGIATGAALSYLATESLFTADHKSVLSLLAFVLIGGLLLLHAMAGLRGRRAARWVLVAYLLLTLAYPGVKFVTDVLIG